MRWQSHHGILTPVAALSGVPYSTEALALFAAMTVQPDAARKTLINSTIVALKAAEIYQQLDLLYLLAAADEQAAKLNWVNPASFAAVAINSPAFVADKGFTGDGSSSRLRTQYTPSTNGVHYTRDDASGWVFVLTNVNETLADIGNNTSPKSIVRSRSSGYPVTCINDATASNGDAVSTSVGFTGGQRISSTVKRIWKDGAQSGADISVSSTGISAQEFWICGANSVIFSTKQIAAVAWGASLTGIEVSFSNILLAYMQGVGAA